MVIYNVQEINQLNSQFKEDSEKLRKTMNNKDDDINELRSQLNHDIEQLQKTINKKDTVLLFKSYYEKNSIKISCIDKRIISNLKYFWTNWCIWSRICL